MQRDEIQKAECAGALVGFLYGTDHASCLRPDELGPVERLIWIKVFFANSTQYRSPVSQRAGT